MVISLHLVIEHFALFGKRVRNELVLSKGRESTRERTREREREKMREREQERRRNRDRERKRECV